MAVVVSVLAGSVAMLAAARVVQLVVTGRCAELREVRRALVVHGAAWLVFVVAGLIALQLPLAAELVLAFMAGAWGAAWLLIGFTYGLSYDAETSSSVDAWPTPTGRFESWARRSAGAPSPPRR